MEAGEGERLHAQRQRKFWKILGGLALVGLVGGFLSGFVMGFADGRGWMLPETSAILMGAGILLLAIAAAYGSWRFFVSVDEVEVADNLWGSLIGFYAYAILFPVWWGFEKLGLAPALDHWVIYGASMVTATLAYAFRKWRAR